MPNYSNKKREILAALVLGAAAHVFNILSGPHLEMEQISWGHIFLFASASTLGLNGALISCAVGIIPLSLADAQHFEGLRLLLLFSAVGYASDKNQRLPGFLVTLVLWLVCFVPGFYLIQNLGLSSYRPIPAQLFSAALNEIMLSLLAGTLLLNGTIWSWVANRPRHVPLNSMLMHSLTFVSTTLILFILNSFSYGATSESLLLASAGPTKLLVWLTVSVILPTYAGWKIGDVIVNNFQSFFVANINSNTLAGNFSGLSSDYWRRHSASKSLARESTQETAPLPETPVYHSFNAKGLAILAVNRNGTICFINQKFRTLAQISANQVIGKNIEAIGMRPEFSKQIMQLVESTFKGGPRVSELRLNELANNNIRFYELASHYSDAFQQSAVSDGPDSVIVTIKNITDRRSVELQLLQAQKLSSLGTVLSEIAQTFSNALTTIAGHASYAKNCDSLAQTRSSLERIIAATSNAGELVKRLLEYCEGKPSIMKAQNLSEVLKDRLELLRRMIGEKWEIDFSASADNMPVLCEPNLLLQALTSLLLNAKESYTTESGKIRISLDSETIAEDVAYLHIGAQPGNFARLRVQDWGVGMSRETLAHAFDPLFTTKSTQGHSGLGLSIVYAIVRAHDGFLTAESHPEKGTTVSIYLPLKDTLAQQPTPEQPTLSNGSEQLQSVALQAKHSNATILVVEDEPEIRDLIAKMLSTLGYKVTSCSNGNEALEKSKQSSFNLFLVDMVMPKMNGLELISRLQSLYPNTSTLVMTGYGITPASTDLGCEVIPKPFSLEDLSKAVQQALESRPSAQTEKSTDSVSA